MNTSDRVSKLIRTLASASLDRVTSTHQDLSGSFDAALERSASGKRKHSEDLHGANRVAGQERLSPIQILINIVPAAPVQAQGGVFETRRQRTVGYLQTSKCPHIDQVFEQVEGVVRQWPIIDVRCQIGWLKSDDLLQGQQLRRDRESDFLWQLVLKAIEEVEKTPLTSRYLMRLEVEASTLQCFAQSSLHIRVFCPLLSKSHEELREQNWTGLEACSHFRNS